MNFEKLAAIILMTHRGLQTLNITCNLGKLDINVVGISWNNSAVVSHGKEL